LTIVFVDQIRFLQLSFENFKIPKQIVEKCIYLKKSAYIIAS
jgi:hypothetical protein